MKKSNMSKKNRSISFLFGILILGYLSGCVNLDKEPLDSLSTGTFWKTESDAMQRLICRKFLS